MQQIMLPFAVLSELKIKSFFREDKNSDIISHFHMLLSLPSCRAAQAAGLPSCQDTFPIDDPEFVSDAHETMKFDLEVQNKHC
jgi:hypothetical protein